MTNTNKIRHIQLGMPFGTAQNKLRKAIMFQMIQRVSLDVCFQCGKKIETIDELSIEHKIPWMNSYNPIKLFFDLDNIAFSHLRCNCAQAIHPTPLSKGRLKHPSLFAYQRGCKCPECKEINQVRVQRGRANRGGR